MVSSEIEVFQIGKKKWEELLCRGIEQKVLNVKEIDFINVAIKYCVSGMGCSSKQAAKVLEIKEKLSENGID